MGRMLRIITAAVVGLLLAGCMSSEPKVAEIQQVSAEQRAAMTATEGAGGGGEGGAAGGGATWVAVDITYETEPSELPAGPVEATLQNTGAIEHNVVFEETGEKVLEAAPGQTDNATIELEPGDYTYFCDIAGHREAGMEGTLTVTG